jgi:hypothetical protein
VYPRRWHRVVWHVGSLHHVVWKARQLQPSLFRTQRAICTLPWRCQCQLSLSLYWSNLSQWPTWCKNFLNTFITIFYMYMFRAISCSSSGGQLALIQHLVSSLSVSDRPVQWCTGRSRIESDDSNCCINASGPPEDEQDIARNMYM